MDSETRQEINRLSHELSDLRNDIKDLSSDLKDCKKGCNLEYKEMRAKVNEHSEHIRGLLEIMPRVEDAVNKLADSVDKLQVTVSNLAIGHAVNTDSVKSTKALAFEVVKWVTLFVLAAAFAKM